MYTPIRQISLSPTDRQILVDTDADRCRLCGRRAPDVTFRDSPHLFPKPLGITHCTTRNLCDSCN
ncbi:MAG: hypothetical protein Q4C37_05775, partial [Bacteroidales bacterium]|nr:hypothetical protein [Bacteroidales bacterium]